MGETEQALRARIAELEAAAAPTLEAFDASVEVTACVLGYHNWKHLFDVLTAFWRQGVSLHMLTTVDRASRDPTRAILSSEDTAHYLTHEDSHTIRSYEYLGEVPHKALEQVCAHAKAKFVGVCKTEFIYFNDGDVVTPQGALKKLLEEMKEDDTIGALCIPYEQKVDHQQQGAMLMRTAIAHEIGFNGTTSCVCKEIAERLKKCGLRMTKWKSGQMAEHGKYWR